MTTLNLIMALATFALAIGLLAMWVIEAHDGGEEARLRDLFLKQCKEIV